MRKLLIMSSLPPRDLETVKVASLSEMAGVAIGLGIGMLIGNQSKDALRRGAGIGLLIAGIASTLPTFLRVLNRQLHHDGSQRSMQSKLASIRDDAGFQSEAELL